MNYKLKKLANGSKQLSLTFFDKVWFVCLIAKNCGWFRLFGIGICWTHRRIQAMFSERICKRKKIKIGSYRYGYLKPYNL